MSNPLDSVTRTVNSLLTALKMPDASSEANDVLGQMRFPQFSRVLPYRDYDAETGLFMNEKTMGFMLEAQPINGANETIVSSLENLMRTKLPREVPVAVHLVSSHLVGQDIEYGLRELSWTGEKADTFNAITRAYYLRAAEEGFPLPDHLNLPLTLRNYRVYISCCVPRKRGSKASVMEMENQVKIIRASLQGAQIATRSVDADAFIRIAGEMINHNPDALYPTERELDPLKDLNYQCVDDTFDLKVKADYMTLGLRGNGRNSTARIMNFQLTKNPELAFLWNMADNYSNLLNPELSVSCPFNRPVVVAFNMKSTVDAFFDSAGRRSLDEAQTKALSDRFNASLEASLRDWQVRHRALILVAPAVVQGAPDITREIQTDVARRMKEGG